MTTRRPTKAQTQTQIPSQTQTEIPTPTQTQTEIPTETQTEIPSQTQTEIPTQTQTQTQWQWQIPTPSLSKPKPWSTSVRPPKDVTKHRNVHLINSDICGKGAAVRIVDGNKTGIFDYPWMTLLAYRINKRVDLSFRCGGTVINERYILTAAHCIFDTDDMYLMNVRIGEHDTTKEQDCEERSGAEVCAPPPQNIEIERYIVHSQYSKTNMNHDIALLRLAQPIVIRENVRPICLPVGLATQTKTYKNKKLLVAGWGATGTDEDRSPDLLKVFLPVVPVPTCYGIFSRMYKHNINARQICAGGSFSTPKDSCRGDSGGPLKTFGEINGEFSMMQVGIVSYGTKRCATPGVPAVHTNVGHYMEWILDNMEE